MSKIRTGFVSNSSSSSFVIIGNEINYDDITPDDIKNKKIFLNSKIYGCEGRIGCNLTQQLYEHIKSIDIIDEIDLIKIKFDIDIDERTVHHVHFDEGDFQCVGGNYDYYSEEYILECKIKDDFLRGDF